MEIDPRYFDHAARIARSATCLRDKCGTVIILDDVVIAEGYNAPPNDDDGNRKCDYPFPLEGRKKPKSDCTCCVHAEWRAIMQAMLLGKDLSNATLYFTRIDDEGNIVPSGEPYCTVCSRLALDAGIGYWALLHEDGRRLYEAKTYNDLSYKFHQ